MVARAISWSARHRAVQYFWRKRYSITFLQSQTAAELQVVDGDIVFSGAGIAGSDRTYTVDDATIEEDGHLILQRVSQRDVNLVVNNLLSVQSDFSIRDSALVMLVAEIVAGTHGPAFDLTDNLSRSGIGAAGRERAG